MLFLLLFMSKEPFEPLLGGGRHAEPAAPFGGTDVVASAASECSKLHTTSAFGALLQGAAEQTG
jgi:hypothetical protein